MFEAYFFPISDFDTMYSVLAEILEVDKFAINRSTGYIYRLKIRTMGIVMDLFINEKDLLGEAKVGRRFKGNIWLQGKVAFV